MNNIKLPLKIRETRISQFENVHRYDVLDSNGTIYCENIWKEEADFICNSVNRYNNLRPEVQSFSQSMEKELKENDYKGGWKNSSKDFLLGKLVEEYSEVKSAVVLKETKEHVLSECADLANIAMMIADIYDTI